MQKLKRKFLPRLNLQFPKTALSRRILLEEVFDEIMQFSETVDSTSAKTFFLISAFSIMASITKSQFLNSESDTHETIRPIIPSDSSCVIFCLFTSFASVDRSAPRDFSV